MSRLPLERVLAEVTQLASSVVSEHADAVDREARWPAESLRALLDAGLGGLVVPRAAGGLGHGLLALARVGEILGSVCGSTAICFGMHCVGSAVIAAKATRDQRERYLEPIGRGAHLTTLALSEPGTGAQFWLPQTQLTVAEDRLIVHGTKTFVTNGSHADSYVVSTVAADPGAPAGEFSCVVIPARSAGITWGQSWQGIGMRGNDARTMTLENVTLPRGDLLGAEGDELWYFFQIIAPYFLIAMAGAYLGIASAALQEAMRHLLGRRYATGTSPAHNPIVQHRLGALWSQVERTRRLIYHAAAAAEDGEAESLGGLLAAKAEVADCAVTVVNEVLTLSGGIAYREGSRLDRHLRDARAAHVMSPTTDILRVWTGRALLGLPLLSD